MIRSHAAGMLLVHGDLAPEPSIASVLGAWPFEPLMWLGVGLAAWWYVRTYKRVPAYPSVRFLHWFVGLAVVALALASPVAVYEGSLFSVHMLQHLLLTLVAAPLLVLGAPVTLALRAASPQGRRRLMRVLHSRPVRFMTHPVVTWSIFALVMWLTHFSTLYDLALENELVHVAEHVLYLTAACLFWLPVIGLDPGANRIGWPGRIAYLFLAMPQQSFLGLAIHQSNEPLYDHYATLARTWGPTTLVDQQQAGTIMWVGGDFLFIAALVLAVLAWMRHEQQATRHLDRRLDEAAL